MTSKPKVTPKIYKVNNKLGNDLSCSIISIEKCYDKNEEYYRYNIELNYGEKKQYIQKRFNDFKAPSLFNSSFDLL